MSRTILARSIAAILFTGIACLVVTQPTAAETSCKSSWFGYCASRYTAGEQAKINSELLAKLQSHLRQQVRYYNGALVIEDQSTHTIDTFPSTIAWSISCDSNGVAVNFGDVSETGDGVIIDLAEEGVDAGVCRNIAGPLGTAVLEITRGE